MPEQNLAVEFLKQLLQGEFKSRFASNGVQDRKFSELLADVIRRYQNRSFETAQHARQCACQMPAVASLFAGLMAACA